MAIAVLAGCGGGSKTIDLNCSAKLQAIARYDTVVDLYRRGELGTRAQLEKWARKHEHEKVPFFDERGRIVPYEQLNDRRRADTDNFTLDVTGVSFKVAEAVHHATARAIREARTRCT